MKKLRKITAFSIGLTFALSSIVGCSKSSNDSIESGSVTAESTTCAIVSDGTDPALDSTTQTKEALTKEAWEVATTVAETKATEAENNASSGETKPAEKTDGSKTYGRDDLVPGTDTADETTTVTFEAIETNDALVAILDMLEGIGSVKMNMEMNVNMNGVDGLAGSESSFKLRAESQWDVEEMIGDGSIYAQIDSGKIKFSDELVHYSLDKREGQFSTKLPDLLSDLMGGKDQVDLFLKQAGTKITFQEIRKISAFRIPIGSSVLNPQKVDSDARKFALDYLRRVFSEIDAACIEEDGQNITVEINGALVASFVRSVAKNTLDSDYKQFYKYLQESGTPTFNETELKTAAGRLANQINTGLAKAGVTKTVLTEDILSAIQNLYSEVSDNAGAQLFESEEELENMFSDFLNTAYKELASKEDYEKYIVQNDEEIKDIFRDGYPKVRIIYDDKAKKMTASADFAITDAATGQKIDMNLVLHIEETEVKITKIPNTVDFSEVVCVGYKLIEAMEKVMGSIFTFDLP